MATMDKNGNMEYQPEELTPPDSVNYFIYRTDVAREHKHAKQWMIATFIVFAALIVGVIWFIWRESQFETVRVEQKVEQTTDQGGDNSNTLYAGDYYGNAESEDNSNNQEAQDGR